MQLPSPAHLPGGRAFVRRIVVHTGVYALFAIGVISLYLSGLLRLSRAQWLGFAEIVGAALVLVFPVMVFAHRGVFRRIRECLDRRAAGRAAAEDLRAGFAAVANFPAYWFAWGLLWWALGGALVGLGMWWRYVDFRLVHAATLLAATLSAAIVTDAYFYLWMKRVLEPVRTALAADLGEPARRRALTREVSLRTKLLVAFSSVIAVTTVFAAFAARVGSERAVEDFALAGQERLLDGLVAELDLAEAARLGARAGVLDRLLLFDPQAGGRAPGPWEGLAPGELARIRAAPERGHQRDAGSGRVVAWRRLPGDGRVAVAALSTAALQPAAGGLGGAFGRLLLFATAVAVGAAVLLARDVGRATELLKGRADRVAEGDLGAGAIVESEDELGELAHTLEGMIASLRRTVAGLAEAAERMQSVAGEIAGASGDVARASAEQTAGLEQATRSVSTMDEQVREIAASAERLRAGLQDASGSVVQLDATGAELTESATALSADVGKTAGSVEQLARSIGRVAQSADALSAVADDASSSMGQTAASVQDVDRNAAEMDRLSRHVIELAERGHQRVQQTIAGMDAIHEATELAERVIRQLAQSVGSIGAVVDVIDDVADETNLLALNAAIIAAQSGEHGRAFGVVAEQIKDLADRVLASTKAIGQLIRAVQTESVNAEKAVARGTESVLRGVDLAGEAGVALEAITGAARESGERIAGIAGAVSEQNRAISHVAGLIGSVRSRSGEIREAIFEQGRNTGALRQSAQRMHEVAGQVHATAAEQARSGHLIRETTQQIREAVEQINTALQEQAASCRQTAELLALVAARTRSNETSVRRLDGAVGGLSRQAEALRAEVRRFRI